MGSNKKGIVVIDPAKGKTLAIGQGFKATMLVRDTYLMVVGTTMSISPITTDASKAPIIVTLR